jgi:membrane associated rhomboid family serine protease
MPPCHTCGTETPREEMYGAPDELRCRTCAQNSYMPFQMRRGRPEGNVYPAVTVTAALAAIAATALYMTEPTGAVRYLIADRVPVWQGQVWRLFTTVFPHVNLLHLLFNLYWLWRFGKVVETWMGSLRFAGFFVVVAMGPVAADFLLAQGGIGLSGVGYALFGLLYALRRDNGFAAEQMQPNVIQLFVGWFFLCILLTYTEAMPVANVAHGAGAVFGWLIGRGVLIRQKLLSLSAIGALAVVLVSLTQYMPWNGDYALHRGAESARMGDFRTALYWYRKALEAHPGDQTLRAYVIWLEQQVDEMRRD